MHAPPKQSKRPRRERKAQAGHHAEMWLRMEVESDPEALCLVRAALERAAEFLQFPEADSRAIVRSVDEAMTNVIRHAYKGRQGQAITVICRRLWRGNDAKVPNGLEVLLQDSGAAVDPKKLRGRALDDIRPGGLGLHYIKQSMDEVEFSRKNGKNLLRMVKYLQPPSQENGEGDCSCR